MKPGRVAVLFSILLVVFGLLIVRLALLSKPESRYSQAAQTHGSYNLKLAATRGTIYDTNLNPLVNQQPAYYAVVSPVENNERQLAALSPLVSDLTTLESKLMERLPFFINVSSANLDETPGIKVVRVDQRYPDQPVAPQLIGYLDNTGNGVAGIEKAYDKELKNYSQVITASFPVDATGRTLTGLDPEVDVQGADSDTGGVQLTIDSTIQQYAQQAADKYLKAGAVIVMDPKNGDILACVSTPTFSQNNLGQAVKGANSPMLNRAFSAYNVGSVFKINVAAAALESGVSSNFTVVDNGNVNVAGRLFNDENKKGYGVLDMGSGMANSSNVYYITLGQQLGGDKILNMAQQLGFGQATTLAPGLVSAAGKLPTSQGLKVPAALANFSIGQGDFMATPVQVAVMLSTVANGGLKPTPQLVKGLVDGNKKLTKTYANTDPVRIFSQSTADQIKQFLIQTVNEGTGKPAKPDYGTAAGKTATAETGWVQDGKTINQAWFAGFYPADSPKYVIVAMMENGVAGGTDAGPVFKSIANALAPTCGFTTQ